ncbi:hypothetical protein [Curvivirga sp.]|uniref:hypothetical protein n=1 Tax=Curvivirga sp. TaxID=2856848 RepID=UPI003B59B406
MSEKTTEVRFVVWQFVRLMVRLEETVEAGAAGEVKDLYNSWEDVWVDLDAKLVDLGRNDPEAFAELMMDQEVVTELTAVECGIVATQLKNVVDDLIEKLKHTDDTEEVEDFSFERDDLTSLVNELKALSKNL